MKSKIKIISVAVVSILSVYGCKKKFLDQLPQGVYSENNLLNKKGIEGMLINAYAALDGNITSSGIGMAVGADNWLYGSISGCEAYKGGVSYGDQTEVNAIMQFATDPSNPNILNKWNSIYDGVARANQVLKDLPLVSDPALSEAAKEQIKAEATFIRGFQHFEAKKLFGNVAFIDETITDFKISNTDAGGNYVNIWPNIEADLKFAYDNLDEVKENKGRVNKWAAGAYLAKAYLYQKKFLEAKDLFAVIIAQGKNSSGVQYDLSPDFGNNFRVVTQGGAESVLEVQMAVDAAGSNGFIDAVLTYPNGIAGGTNSWFFRPSQNAVNTFRTDAAGLPMPDAYNNENVTPHEGVADSDPFTPYQANLDPRLDHTVGRRGIPYLDWGMMTGEGFTAPPGESIQNGGAYCGKKQVFSKAEFSGSLAGKVNWGYFSNALNYEAMRFADVLLMAAECEVEVGSLDKAREYVNRVRQRAANSVIKNLAGTANAANYKVGLYATAWGSPDEARKAVRFERRLELAEEGHRFFDLVRWGIADQEINTNYLPKELALRPLIFNTGVHFDKNKDEYQPIPNYVISQSMVDGKPTTKQNPGY